MSLNEWTDEQRQVAIADLYERAAKATRDGHKDDVKEIAERARRIADGCNNPGSHYGNALFFARVERVDADAAMLAISEGRIPSDSLRARLFAIADTADGSARHHGKRSMARQALYWIGAKR